ncbi:MAG: hypothetical protein PHD65_13310 [Gallionella sp.]|nr:hypothetical protein [Gallionella sp.]
MEFLRYNKNGCSLSVEISQSTNINYNVIFCGPLTTINPQMRRVHLLAAFELGAPRIYMEDLRGNGHSSGLHAQGTGTLLFNTLLQFFHRDYSPNTPVYGELSTIGDPKEPSLAKMCAEHREGFWSSFNFRIEDGTRAQRVIRASLGALKPKLTEKTIQGLFPRFIDIGELTHEPHP